MKVNVLMSTYNGEHYIKQQLDSIMSQEKVDVDLLVRDDGSWDSTLGILQKYKEKGKLRWYKGENQGPARSFLTLLQDSSDDADFYAFADQDDFWKPEKLDVAVEKLKASKNVPALYFSRTQMTDATLKPTGIIEIEPLLTFGESLVYEFIPGCTMVFNRKLRDIVNRYSPAYLPMHDVWIYSVALAVGAKIYFDKSPHILYRQHGSNTIGQGYSIWHEWKRRIYRFTHSEHSRYHRSYEIRKGYFDFMSKENIGLLDDFINCKYNFLNRIRLCFDKRYDCSRKSTRRLFNIALLLNSY